MEVVSTKRGLARGLAPRARGSAAIGAYAAAMAMEIDRASIPLKLVLLFKRITDEVQKREAAAAEGAIVWNPMDRPGRVSESKSPADERE